MSTPDIAKIRRIVKEVLNAEMQKGALKREPRVPQDGPRVLIVYHGGTAHLETAQKAADRIAENSFKSSTLTSEAAREGICGIGPDGRPKGQCTLDTVDRPGLEKVLEKADLLVLPTFCLTVAAKVSRLEFGDPDAGLVLSALVQNKPVLASNDGFLVLGRLKNEKLGREFDRILSVLADWGVTFTPTENLADAFFEMTAKGKPAAPVDKPASGDDSGLKLISANHIRNAVNDKKKEIYLAPGGLITPLARDLAKDYSITIKKLGA